MAFAQRTTRDPNQKVKGAEGFGSIPDGSNSFGEASSDVASPAVDTHGFYGYDPSTVGLALSALGSIPGSPVSIPAMAFQAANQAGLAGNSNLSYNGMPAEATFTTPFEAVMNAFQGKANYQTFGIDGPQPALTDRSGETAAQFGPPANAPYGWYSEPGKSPVFSYNQDPNAKGETPGAKGMPNEGKNNNFGPTGKPAEAPASPKQGHVDAEPTDDPSDPATPSGHAAAAAQADAAAAAAAAAANNGIANSTANDGNQGMPGDGSPGTGGTPGTPGETGDSPGGTPGSAAAWHTGGPVPDMGGQDVPNQTLQGGEYVVPRGGFADSLRAMDPRYSQLMQRSPIGNYIDPEMAAKGQLMSKLQEMAGGGAPQADAGVNGAAGAASGYNSRTAQSPQDNPGEQQEPEQLNGAASKSDIAMSGLRKIMLEFGSGNGGRGGRR